VGHYWPQHEVSYQWKRELRLWRAKTLDSRILHQS
jgi:hypothetical protein